MAPAESKEETPANAPAKGVSARRVFGGIEATATEASGEKLLIRVRKKLEPGPWALKRDQFENQWWLGVQASWCCTCAAGASWAATYRSPDKRDTWPFARKVRTKVLRTFPGGLGPFVSVLKTNDSSCDFGEKEATRRFHPFCGVALSGRFTIHKGSVVSSTVIWIPS